MRKSASEIIHNLEMRVAQLEKESARRPKSLAQTISELNSAISGDLDRKDPKFFAKLSRDPRLSKELQSAFRNFHKIYDKYMLVRKTIRSQGKLELDEMMDSGYASEIARVVNICKDVLSNLRIEYKGKKASLSSYLTFEENRGSYALEVNFKSGQFENRNWGRPGNFMARGTWVSLLDQDESDELDSIIGKEATKAIDAALPGFSASLRSGPSWLGVPGYDGANWDIPKEEIIKYLDSL